MQSTTPPAALPPPPLTQGRLKRKGLAVGHTKKTSSEEVLCTSGSCVRSTTPQRPLWEPLPAPGPFAKHHLKGPLVGLRSSGGHVRGME